MNFIGWIFFGCVAVYAAGMLVAYLHAYNEVHAFYEKWPYALTDEEIERVAVQRGDEAAPKSWLYIYKQWRK